LTEEIAMYELRTSFLPLIPEFDIATDLMAEAADALIAGDLDQARIKVREANIQPVHAFTARVLRSWKDPIHELRCVEQLRPITALDPVRSASSKLKAKIYTEDGYRCRYCGVRVVLPDACLIFRQAFPELDVRTDRELHAVFYALKATYDHVIPHSLGGRTNRSNLVTACQSCNYGKGLRTLAQIGFVDPWTRPPIVDGWDGLGRMLTGVTQ
jgi:5-methylcytosine-specific restriction endonuclease McrA